MPSDRFHPTDVSFTHVADMYVAELRKGNRLPLEHLVAAFPHLAAEIREQLPAVALIEKAVGQTPAAQVVTESLAHLELAGCVLLREVGRGAVGTVYEAEQKGMGRRVAVKVIPLLGGNSRSAIERFELERRTMAQLDHPHIIPVYTYGHTHKYAYLVMKLIDGFSLYDLFHGQGDHRTRFYFKELQTNPVALAELGVQIASALAHAHDQKLVHRDVKPGNLLLDSQGKVWLTDFGLAKVFDSNRSLSGTGDVIGTPRYMAPEQLRGVCDARSDVYSLGITLYELAHGQQVWEDRSAFSLMTAKETESLTSLPPLPADFPPSLAEIITKTCAFAPDDRYQTAQELKIVLERFLAGLTPSDRRRGRRDPDEVYRRKARRRNAIAATVTALASCAGGVYWNYPRTTTSAPSNVATTAHLPSSSIAPASALPNDPASTPPTMIPTSIQGATAANSAVNLIDRLADGSQEDMVDIVSDYLQESLGGTGKDLAFSDQHQQEIHRQVEDIAQQIRTTGLTEESLDTFLRGYRKTSLPVATQVMRVTTVVMNAPLSQQEKQQAIITLRTLAALTVAKRIPEPTTSALVNELTGGLNSTAQVAALRVPAHQLRRWLARATQLADSVPMTVDEQRQIVTQELRQVFDEAFRQQQTHSPRRNVPQRTP